MAERSGPKKALVCILFFFGAFLLVAAILIPTYTLPKLAKTPLDLEVTTIAVTPQNQGGEVLDARSLTSPTGAAVVDKNVPLVSQRFITVEEPSDSDVVTLQGGSTLRRTDKSADTGLLTASVVKGTFDRKTGDPIESDKGAIQVQNDKPAEEVDITGLVYRFPFNTEKKTYQYYDTNSRETHPIDFVEETEINGEKVYHFNQKVPATDLSKVVDSPTNKLKLPAAKWGVTDTTEDVTMTRWYSNERDIWVDPITGTVISGQEKPFQYYARSADKPEVTVLKATLAYDENTIENQITTAKDGADKISLYGKVLPIILGIIGIVALIAGLILLFLGRGEPGRRRANGGSTGVPPGAGAPQPSEGRGGQSWTGTNDRTEEIPVQRPNLNK